MRKVLVVLTLSALALAACGGSSSSKGSTNNGSSSGSSAFDELYNKRQNASLVVTYQSTNEDGSQGDLFTIAQDGPTKAAVTQGNSSTIVNSDTAYQCENLDSSPTCTPYPGGIEAAKAAIAGMSAALTLANTVITGAAQTHQFGKTSSENIAGRDASCVTISPAGIVGGAIAKAIGNASFESCLDKSTGVVLKWQASGGGKSESVVATKVTTPSDADFQPPANATTETTAGGSGSSDTTEGGSGGSTGTTTCTPSTLPGGITVPGYTLPCQPG